jgi:hypothetical protein
MHIKVMLIVVLLSAAVLISGCKTNTSDSSSYNSTYRLDLEENSTRLLLLASKGNISACAPLTDVVNLKRGCYYNLAIYYNDTPFCNKIYDINEMGYCYQAQARFSGKVEPCNKIANQTIKDWCKWDVVRYLPSCDDIITLPYKDYCLNYMAEKYVKVEFCNSIHDMNYLNECYISLAKITNNTYTCDLLYQKIKMRDSYDNCITEIAWLNQNPNFCKLVSPEKKSNCEATAQRLV